jgi:hypothetical protein
MSQFYRNQNSVNTIESPLRTNGKPSVIQLPSIQYVSFNTDGGMDDKSKANYGVVYASGDNDQDQANDCCCCNGCLAYYQEMDYNRSIGPKTWSTNVPASMGVNVDDDFARYNSEFGFNHNGLFVDENNDFFAGLMGRQNNHEQQEQEQLHQTPYSFNSNSLNSIGTSGSDEYIYNDGFKTEPFIDHVNSNQFANIYAYHQQHDTTSKKAYKRKFKDLFDPPNCLNQPNLTTIMQKPGRPDRNLKIKEKSECKNCPYVFDCKVDMGETKRYKRRNLDDLEKRRVFVCSYSGKRMHKAYEMLSKT